MRKFICGNITRNEITYKKEKLLLNQVRWKGVNFDDDRVKELEGVEKNLFSPSKVVHGCGAMILENEKIAFSCHTSKATSKIHEINMNNILIKETINPIAFVNPIQVMSVEEFKKYYNMGEPGEMLRNIRYGAEHAAHDLNYLSFRALWRSLCSLENVIGLKLEKKEIVFSDTVLGGDENLWTPAQVLLDDEFDCKNGYLAKLVQDMTGDIAKLDGDEDLKKKFLELVNKNYTNFIENKEYDENMKTANEIIE